MRNLGRAPRLHLDGPLARGAVVELGADRVHQLRHVLRLAPGAPVRLFNAESGEWWAELTRLDRRGGEARIVDRLRPPEPAIGPRLAIAPIRPNRLDWLIEKAVELGVGAVDLVLTQRTVVRPARIDRLLAIAVEAAEQCERLSVPPIGGPTELEVWLAGLPPGTRVVVADEEGGEPPLAALGRISDAILLVGPEGGFAPGERRRLAESPGIVRVGLGRRILRSETAALFLLVAHALAREEVRPSCP
ncbi:MAG: ribosomal RNA small subunit methyltransferase E [Geminicoccaceae bacterium]|nr:MAG: ribosomal RNA small subunit methyltransferase E [Geminicoccaceae bacterium]